MHTDGDTTDMGESTYSNLSTVTLTPDSVASLVDVESLQSTEEVAKALIEFIITRSVCRNIQ